MRILVTGGGGFAGRHLLRLLLRDENVELFATGLERPVDLTPELERVRWLPMDVCSDASVTEAVAESRPEQVYHLAGQASVGESFDAPLATWEINATGTLRLLNILSEEAADLSRFLLVSSAEVYGAVGEDQQPITEETPLRPLTPYGASKHAAESLSLQHGRAADLDVVVARSFNHFGPGQDSRFVIPTMANQLNSMKDQGGEHILHVGNLDVSRDFLDVRDVARAYVTIMADGETGQVYNVCSGRARRLSDVVTRLVELSGAQAKIEVDPDRFRPADIPVLRGDGSRLQALGWEPQIEMDRTLSDVLRTAQS